MNKKAVKQILDRVSMSCLGKHFEMIVSYDLYSKNNKRIFIQVRYRTVCTKTGEMDFWKGRKWYLSRHMTSDEVIKTAYAAFEAAVKHEVMEGFKVDGKVLFNPHVHFESLLKITHNEIKRS
jgi:hypothetical protein